MNSTTHIAGGLLFVTSTTGIMPIQENLPLLGCVVLGSLLPDVDKANSTLGRFVPFIEPIAEHRKFFHSYEFLFLVVCCIGLVSKIYNVPLIYTFLIGLGMLSHLFLDMWNTKGVMLFYFTKKMTRFPIHFSTKNFGGKILEKALGLSLTGLYIYLYCPTISAKIVPLLSLILDTIKNQLFY